MAPARSGGLVIALRDGIYRAREWGGELVAMARVEHDVRTMRFNDGKCDPLGRFWGGTLNEAKDRANAALYCFDARSGTDISPTLSQMANESTTANGLAFSPDARTLYWADTAAHVVCAWDWDAEANALSHARVFHQFDPSPKAGRPIRRFAYEGRPMARRSTRRGTTGSRCSKARNCCASRLRESGWPPSPRRCNVRRCRVSAATT
jgi:sugar lactone lactonase YvrE